MFLLIPFTFILISACGICFIIWRKMPYLRKLTPEAHEIGGNVFNEFFPEVVDGFNKFKWSDYSEYILGEFEKNLRRLRLLSLKLDHATLALINKVRNISNVIRKKEDITAVKIETKPIEKENGSIDRLKKTEQELIINIAKDPKNSDLYIQLGDLYMDIGDPREAKEAYEAALKLKPEDTLIASKLSQITPSI